MSKRWAMSRTVLLGLIGSVWLSGCANMNKASEDLANTVTPKDVVTGQRTLNMESRAHEIRRATQQEAEILAQAKANGAAVDDNPEEVKRLQMILNRLKAVSHRPDLPWEIHLIDAPTINAFTIGGGKIFVFQGLFGKLIAPDDDDQLAAVIAHEMGHVAYRHVSKQMSIQALSAMSKKIRRSVSGAMYKASFTTLQEKQADQISVLYMALAGYNPQAAPRIWARAAQQFGNDPGNFLYDHPLPKARKQALDALVPVAMKYYKGEGVRNPQYQQILASNEIIPKAHSVGSNGFVDLLQGVVGTYDQHLRAKNEELKRKRALQQENLTVSRSIQLNFSIQPTRDGHQGLFGQIRNIGAQPVTAVHIAVYYYASNGKVLHVQPVSIQHVNLPTGATTQWSAYLLAVPHSTRVAAQVVGGRAAH